MKKLSILLISFLCLIWASNAQLEIPWESSIYSNNQSNYIDASGISNPLRDWTYTAIQSPDSESEIWGIQWIDNKIEDHDSAREKTFTIVKNLINYALGLLSLIALIYVIYHGIIIITAAGDDSKYKQWLKWIRTAAIALVWIWLSRIVVSSIFRLIFEVLLKPTV